ncbi:MAG: J domain-containing protein [Bacteroidia bacterium]|nr:J domain-containing protein [Bacteroidia bacterium]
MIEHNYYQLMGLELYSDASVVKRKYRELAMLYHPDKNPDIIGAEEFFKILTQGYNVLSEPDQKMRYDMMLRNFLDKSSIETIINWEAKERKNAAERIRMHKERKRQSIIEHFEEENASFSHKLRFVIAILLYVSGLLLAYNNWFLNLLDLSVVFIILGSFMFGLGAYLIANNRYQIRLYELAKKQKDFIALKGPVRLFTFLFLITPVLFLMFTSLTKTIHLAYFYDITVVDRIDEFPDGVTYQYTVRGVEIARQVDELPMSIEFLGDPENRKKAFRVKFSRINPNISEIITKEMASTLVLESK